MEEKVISKMEESIEKILDEGLNTNNLDTLVKLSKVKRYAKEDKEMYGNYEGRGPGYDAYGRGNYGEYNGYGNYGASEETDKSYHYMVKALEDFIKVLEEEADTPQQKQMLREALQNSMR